MMGKQASRLHRRHIGLWAWVLILLILGLQYLAGSTAVELARNSMESDLERHLGDMGRLAQTSLHDVALGINDRHQDAEWGAMTDTSATQSLRPRPDAYRRALNSYLTEPLVQFASQARLAKLVLIGTDGHVLYDTAQPMRMLVRFDFWSLDSQEIAQALAGRAAASPAYTVADRSYKRYYVPIVESPGKASAVLCLVAGRDYLDLLGPLSSNIARLNLILTVLMALVGLMIYSILKRQRRMERGAAEADRLAGLGRLAAGFAHELRNPLEIVRAFTEDLERSVLAGEPREHAAEACREIVEEVDRMNHLVGQFLSFSRQGGGRPEIATEQAEAAAPAFEGLRSVLTILAPTAQREGVRIEGPATPEPGGDGLRVGLSAALLKQVLMNLLLNAIQASPRGGRVWTELKTSSRAVELRVCDEGLGVAAGDRAKIFEPFFTTRASGAGLGLAISRQIALAAGGSLDLAAPPSGRGACFVLSLPRA